MLEPLLFSCGISPPVVRAGKGIGKEKNHVTRSGLISDGGITF
jgi:hypothetical protein